jgi:diguanylate cyclase (GGDEF)-like protein/PAS domain S-box-containing protein
MPPELARSHRQRPLGILFVVSNAVLVELCLQHLEEAQFIASADVVLTPAQCAKKLRSQSYDLVIAEYPSSSWSGSPDLKLFHQAVQEIPLLFLVTARRNESMAELTAHGAFDYFEQSHVVQLPRAVRRILQERRLRIELEEAEKALRRSQSQYRALADNPAYGILRCDAEGKFLDVNEALVEMLGYAGKDELLAASESSEIVLDPGLAMRFGSPSAEKNRIDAVEVEWERKNGTILRAKLSGRGVYAEDGRFIRYEIIVVDITEQREIESQLRRQASSDPLTGLANRRSLFESLHTEICRCNRTKREFSFVLLDLDGLKETNDRYGHPVGDRALCRLGQILADCSRSVDTLARHGGDEFALILPETDVASAEVVAKRICTLLEGDTEEPALSVSFGIAGFPRGADAIATLIQAADVALYAMRRKRPVRAWAARVP